MGFWVKNPTLSYAFSRLRTIYSQANALYSPRNERFDFLLMAVGDLSRQHRKGKNELYEIAVAQIFAWFMSLAEAFFVEKGGDIIATAMSQKYPNDHCGYCGKLPCVCKEEERGEHKIARISQADGLEYRTLAEAFPHTLRKGQCQRRGTTGA